MNGCEQPFQRRKYSLVYEGILRHKDLHAYGKICESVHKTVSVN